MNGKIQIVTITKTVGTGSNAGLINIDKTDYPNSKAIIPLGSSTDANYIVLGCRVMSTHYNLLVKPSTNVNTWASGVDITFQAMVIY